MKPISTGIVGAALFAMTAVAAQADCAAELALLTGEAGATEGISKDGSLAPLESASDAAAGSGGAPATNNVAPTESASTDTATTGSASTDSSASSAASTGTAADGGEIAKDGSHVPLEDTSGQQAGVAMSGADAQAQQEGEPTAAEQAQVEQTSDGAAGTSSDQSARDAHIKAAQDALAAGDEDACMAAVQAAQS